MDKETFTPEQLSVLREIANQVSAGKTAWKWFKSLGAMVGALLLVTWTLINIYHAITGSK